MVTLKLTQFNALLMRPIYLDYHATSPVDERVWQAMLPYWREMFGNPASRGHYYGWEAQAAVELAREQVAASLNTTPESIIFTSGATEANNLAIKGVASVAVPVVVVLGGRLGWLGGWGCPHGCNS